MKTFAPIAMISAIMLLSLSDAFAQNDVATAPIKIKKSFWFDLGLGWGGQGTAYDLGFSYEVAPNRLMSLHYSGSLQISIVTKSLLLFRLRAQWEKVLNQWNFRMVFSEKEGLVFLRFRVA
jgi:hypothetical protein